MATSFVQQKTCSTELDSSLSLDLSLGGLFSQPKSPTDTKCSNLVAPSFNNEEKQAPPLPSKHSRNNDSLMWDIIPPLSFATPSSSTLSENPHQVLDRMDGMHSRKHHDSVKRRKGLESKETRQQKRARKEGDSSNKGHGSSSLCNSYVSNSGHLHQSYRLPTDYHEHSSLQLDRKYMRSGFDEVSMPSNGSHHRISDTKKSEICRESTLHQPNPEAPASLVSCSHSPVVSYSIPSVHAQTTPSCTSSSFSPTQTASCPSTSSLTLITPSSIPSSRAPTLASAHGTGSNDIINHILPTKWKSRIGNEERKGCHSSSSELENGDNEDEESTTQTKVTEFEAPRSRCGSNSDIIASMGPSAAIPSSSPMMYTHPFGMLPIRSPFSAPIQWGYTLPYAYMYHSPHMMPPLASEISKSFTSPLGSSFVTNHLPENTSQPWIPFVPASASGLQPGVPAGSCNQVKPRDIKKETSCAQDELACGLALSTPSSAKNAKVQPLISKIKELSPAMVHQTIPTAVSDVCTSATSSRPSFSTSPMANYSSIVCTSSMRQVMSPTSSDSNTQVDSSKPGPVNEICRSSLLKACPNLSTTGDGIIPCQQLSHNQADRSKASNSCCLKSDDAGLVGNSLGGQSQHSISPGWKPTKSVRFSSDDQKSISTGKLMKTVRFSSDERELIKCISTEDQRHASSSLLRKSNNICKSDEMGKSCKNQLVKKMLTLGGEPLYHRIQHNSGLAKRTTQERLPDDGSSNTQITSDGLDQSESAPLKIKGAGKLEGRNLPQVSTTCAGPNGKTIHGVMYITKTKQTCLICRCHGMHMSPSEFVQHSGSTDLSNPERSIVVTGFSCVKQV